MSPTRCGLQLRRRKPVETAAFQSAASIKFDELEAAHVHRTRVADVPARGERAIPYLLGLQPGAPRQSGEPADSDHARHVPGGRGRRLHLSPGGEHVRSEFPVAGAAQNVPIHGRDYVLSCLTVPEGVTIMTMIHAI